MDEINNLEEQNIPKWYKINPEKIRLSHQRNIEYLFGDFAVSETYEHFEKVKHFLDIPGNEDLKEDTPQMYISVQNQFQKSDWSNTYGYFSNTNILGSSQMKIDQPYNSEIKIIRSFILDQGGSVGYFKYGDYFQVHLKKKPNFIIKFLARIILNFIWIDKND
jgi:hypothetical protein